MPHGDLAQIAALAGAAGSVLALAASRRRFLLAGFALLVGAEAMLAVALVPRSDLAKLGSPPRIAALALALLAVVALAALLVRLPALVPLVLLLAAPFRLPVDLGRQHVFLLLPLYGVLAAAVLAFAYRAASHPVPRIPWILAAPAVVFIALDGLSLTWSRDVEQGTIELLFFIFPFVALLAVIARAPWVRWLPRALLAGIVGLACVFSVIGLWQAWTHTLFFAQDLRVANAYTSYFRVTSVFKDPSLYGRHLVLAIAVLLVPLWLSRVNLVLGSGLIALLFAGLYFSYSQSSMGVLFVAAVAVTMVVGDRLGRRVVGVAALVLVLAAAGIVAAEVQGNSLKRVTSGRSRLVSVTTTVIHRNPLYGVGVGAQPKASQEETRARSGPRRVASHTTPLTVAAELGAVGVLAYLALLAGAARLLLLTRRRYGAVGAGLGAAFLVLFLHSLFYSGFFEDPITWGVLGVAAVSLAAPALVLEEETAPAAAGEVAARGPGRARALLGRAVTHWHT